MSIKKSFVVGLSALLVTAAVSQPANADSLYALDAWDENVLWIIDPADGSTIGAHSVDLPSGNIERQTGMAVDPISGTMYVVIAVDNSFTRSLFTLDPETGNATLVGVLTAPFASIVFDESGTLYGVTGSSNTISADNRNALFELDTTDASMTRLCKFDNGNQGHALAYGDGVLYHAQQAGTDWQGDTILESVDTSSFPVTNTDPCPTTSIPLDYDGGALPIHPMSILVTETGTGTATLLLSGWNKLGGSPEFFSVAVDSGSAEATQIGFPDSYFKGMAFHAFTPTTIVQNSQIGISKVSAKFRDGKERRVVYTIQVYNFSSDPLPNITLTDVLDVSKTAYLSDNAGCDLTGGGNVVSCDLGTIAANSSETVTIDTSVVCKGKNCSSVFNQATINISLDQWVRDPSTDSISANVTTELKGKY